MRFEWFVGRGGVGVEFEFFLVYLNGKMGFFKKLFGIGFLRLNSFFYLWDFGCCALRVSEVDEGGGREGCVFGYY